jgi:hypothetical protein
MKNEIREKLDAALNAYEAAKSGQLQADTRSREANSAQCAADNALNAACRELEAAMKAFKEAV